MWVKVEERLPEADKYVLARHNRGTWFDSDDQENVICVVVKLVIGLSKKERELLSDDDPRKNVFTAEDEGFNNNEKGFGWNEFGPDFFCGQEITHWMPIPLFVRNQEYWAH